MNILLHGAVARLGFDTLLQHFGDSIALAVTDSRDGDATRGLIGAAQLARMSPHAVLINVFRGPIIDQDAASRSPTSHLYQASNGG